MNRAQLLTSAFLLFPLVLGPSARALADELTLPRLLFDMAASSVDLKKEELVLLKARALHQEQAAFLYPTITLSFPAGWSYAPFSEFYYTSSSSVLAADGYGFDFSPALSLSQALPTSGTLDFSLKNTLTVGVPGAASNPLIAPYLPAVAYRNLVTATVSLRQPLFFEDAFGASLAVLDHTLRLAEAGYRRARNALVFQAAGDYYGLKRLKYAEVLAALGLKDARVGYEDAQKRFAVGSITRLVLLKEESLLKKAELEAFDAAAAFREEYARLTLLYGFKSAYEVSEALSPMNLTDPPGVEEVKTRAVAGNPDIALGRHDLEIKKARVTTLACQEAHTLTLSGSLVFDTVNPYAVTLADALSDAFDGSANPKPSLSLKLTMRLFDGGAARERLRQAEWDAQLSALALSGIKDGLEGRVAYVLGKLERAKLSVSYREAAREVAVQEYEKARRDFSLGQISRLELDRLEAAYRSAQIGSLQAMSERELALLDVFQLMGEDLFSVVTGEKR